MFPDGGRSKNGNGEGRGLSLGVTGGVKRGKRSKTRGDATRVGQRVLLGRAQGTLTQATGKRSGEAKDNPNPGETCEEK